MAEIKIEKKNAPIWPWILVALAFLAILIYLFLPRDERNEGDELTEATMEESYASSDTPEVTPNSTAVLSFVNFINEDPNKMDIDHEFTNEALLRLTNATNAMAEEINYDIKKDLGEVKTYADKITTDPFETTHANSIKSAAEILATVLQNIQQKAFPSLTGDADAVMKAATDIKVDVLTLDQKEQIKNYFKQSADLLERMNTNSPQL